MYVVDVFKKIPGTPAYWKVFRNEMFARMEQLGPFQFFFTLSSAEMHWPDVATSILHTIGRKIVYEEGWEEDQNKIKIEVEVDGELTLMPLPEYKAKYWRHKSQDYKDNFLLITRIFDNKVKAFVKLLTGSGEVEHFAYRIEFQIRGMPHVHGVFWLRKDIMEKYMVDEEYDDKEITKLIDKWISCSLDTGNDELNKLVSEVNVHSHTSSCQRGTLACRFNFPKLPSDETLIASPLPTNLSDEEREEILSESKAILAVVKEKLDIKNLTDEDIDKKYKNDLKSFLKDLDIDYEAYKKAIRISERGKIVVLKRTLKERNVNNFNKEWMLAWRANLDLQFCYDGFAVVTYLTDYFSKADAGVTAALKKGLTETKGWNDFERLNYLKRCFFTHRQVSVAEAAYRLIPGMNLKASNIKTDFVSSGYPENRSNFYRNVKNKDGMDLESDGENEEPVYSSGNSREHFNIPGRKGKFQTGETIHTKYSNRPVKLEDVCLAQFFTSYVSCQRPGKKIKFDEGCSTAEGSILQFGTKTKLPKYIELQSNKFMRLRISPIIMRIHSSKKKKEDEVLYAELLLFYPWRNEETLREQCTELFDKHYKLIEANKTSIYPNSSMVDVLRELINNSEDARPIHLSEIDPAGEQENMDNEAILESLDTDELPEEEEKEEPEPTNFKIDNLFKPIIVDDPNLMLEYARSLSFEQRIVFDKIIKFCKQVKRSKKVAAVVPKPPQLIVKGKNIISYFCVYYIIIFFFPGTGNGGVGKSYLSRTICKWTEKILSKSGLIKTKVVRLAYAAIAASNIGKHFYFVFNSIFSCVLTLFFIL